MKATLTYFSTSGNKPTADDDKSNVLKEVTLGNKRKRLRDIMNDTSTFDKLPEKASLICSLN